MVFGYLYLSVNIIIGLIKSLIESLRLDFTYLPQGKNLRNWIYPLLPGLGSSESFIKVKADKKWGCENDNIEFAPSNSFSFG